MVILGYLVHNEREWQMGTSSNTVMMRCSPSNSLFKALTPNFRNSNLVPNSSLPLSSSTQINKGASRCSHSHGGGTGRAYDALLLDAGGTLLQLANPVEDTYATIGSKYGSLLSSLVAWYIIAYENNL